MQAKLIAPHSEQAYFVDEVNAIGAWARLPYHPWREVISSWNWFPQWLFRITDRPDTIAAFGLTSFSLIYFVLARKAFRLRTKSAIGSISVILGIGLFSLIFWVLSAPDPRFLGAVLWIVLLGVVGVVFDGVLLEEQIRSSKILFLLSWIAVGFMLCQERSCAHLFNEWQAGRIDNQAGSNKMRYRIRSDDLRTCPGRRMLGCSVTLHALFPAPIEAARQVVICRLLPRRIRCSCSRFLISGVR